METYTAVIPTYNELDNVRTVAKRILALPENYRILFVDDNSPDGTGAVEDQLASDHPKRIDVLHRERKEGLGKAYVAGFRHALQQKPAAIFEIDADLSHDPDDLPRFVDALDHADVVVGSRYLRGVSVVNWPIRRLLLSRTASWYVRMVTGLPVTDATSGFKAYRRAVLEQLDLERIHASGYAFQIEMKYAAYRSGFRLHEIPIVFTDRSEGTSKMSQQVVWEAIRMVWRLRFFRSNYLTPTKEQE